MQKYDIINALARRHGLTSYIEICTPSTGNEFSNIDRLQFETCHRLMYNCPPEHVEELPIDFRTAECSSAPLVRAILDAGQPRYDVVFVDSFHTYRCSSLDMSAALRLVRDGGIIVTHDCDPRDPAICTPEFKSGSWCGLSYAAFIDFVLPRDTLDYYTVDTDFGCGVVFVAPSRSGYKPPARDRHALDFEWRAVGTRDEDRLAFYLANRVALLNVISPSEFLAVEGIPADGAFADTAISLGVQGEIPLLPSEPPG